MTDYTDEVVPTFPITGFGAAVDGATNDTSAINSAISAASSAGGGNVVFPPGTTIAHGIDLEDIPNVSLVGSGDARQNSSYVLSHSTGSTAVVSAGSAAGTLIEGLRIENDRSLVHRQDPRPRPSGWRLAGHQRGHDPPLLPEGGSAGELDGRCC